MRRHFTRQQQLLRALVSLAFIVFAAYFQLSPPGAASRASAQATAAPASTQTSQAAAAAAAGRVALTPEENRGKQIYLRGTSASGREITAYLGEGSLEVPASAITCAGCHGAEGQGKPEGGIAPSNLTWAALTKPYGITHASGRKHPPYTERALELALTRGLDPAGNRLLNVMPRYQMAREDMNDLIAYLKRLGTDRDPGVTDTSIRIGMLVSARTGALAEMGAAIKSVAAAYFEEVNSQGGIYNRKIELKFAETGDSAAATSASVERLIRDEQIFALSGAMIAGADKEIATLAQTSEVPLVGPFTLYPPVTPSVNRQVFYLLSGIDDQARALVVFAAQKFADDKSKRPRAAVVYQESDVNAGVAAAIEQQIKKEGWSAPAVVKYARAGFDAAGVVRELSAKGVNAVFLVGGSEDQRALLAGAEKSNWTPALYLPGALTGRDILDAPQAFKGKIFLSFPSLPSDIKPAALENLRALAAKYKLPQGHVAAQISAYVSAQLLVEGLKRAGRDLSREKLIAALEGLYEYDTGLTPRLTYGPNRRVGAAGAYIVNVETEKKQFAPASGWIAIK
ncbi:MAG TPA: ABC transporter substrate-binding protein [Pyrinomonadaceae bacterium]|nr:ABC transporter substrate-binding protein [Pyrinomonadaceae bacterium]